MSYYSSKSGLYEEEEGCYSSFSSIDRHFGFQQRQTLTSSKTEMIEPILREEEGTRWTSWCVVPIDVGDAVIGFVFMRFLFLPFAGSAKEKRHSM